MIHSLSSVRLRRRTLLSGVAASGLSMPFISRGLAAESIKIAFLRPVQGERAATVGDMDEAAKLLLAHQGEKTLGRPVEMLYMDENTPESTVANVKRAIETDKAAAIFGGTYAASLLAAYPVIRQAKIPHVVSISSYDSLTGKACSPWAFRVSVPFQVQFRALLPYMTGYGKKWFVMGVDSVPGRSIAEYARTEMKAAGATEIGTATVPRDDKADFGPAIQKIKDAKPDVIVGALLGIELTHFLQAWHAAGMTDKIPFAQVGLIDSEAYAAGKEAITGVFTKPWHYADPQISPEDKQFVEAYRKESGGMPPSTIAWQTYLGLRSLLSAIDSAGSTDPEKIRQGLLAFRYPSGNTQLFFRESDLQMMHRLPVLETKTEISDPYNWWDVETHYPEKLPDLEKMYGTAKDNGCVMAAG